MCDRILHIVYSECPYKYRKIYIIAFQPQIHTLSLYKCCTKQNMIVNQKVITNRKENR